MPNETLVLPEDVTGPPAKRNRVFACKMTESEFEAVHAIAARYGLSVSEYGRTMLLAQFYAAQAQERLDLADAMARDGLFPPDGVTPFLECDEAVWRLAHMMGDALASIEHGESVLRRLKDFLMPTLREVMRAFARLGHPGTQREERDG
jgi:hypothetical protein